MVFFTCNHCGEALKKQAVEKHGYRCKRELSVSCMDCNKDFYGKEYDAHTSCVTEMQRYSDKNYVPKANANKGARKQETWISTIRAITEAKRNLPKGVMSVFEVIQRNDNIPRKMKGFMNFFQNSAKYIRKPDVEAAWALIEEEVKRSKPQPVEPAAKTSEQKPPNETTAPTNGSSAKRKQEPEQVPEQPAGKKRKTANTSNGTENGHSVEAVGNGTTESHAAENDDQTNGSEKFRWNDVIRSLLVSKNNQMKLSKLKKKVLKRYRKFSDGDGAERKFEKKFSKKLLKAQFIVESDTVRLVA